MIKSLKIPIVISILFIVGLFVFYQNRTPAETEVKEKSVENGDYFPIPSIDTNEEYESYAKSFKTYASDLGFSFKYPPHLKVLIDFEVSVERVILIPVDIEADSKSFASIIISVGENDEEMTPEEWLLGPTSGFDHSKKYFKDKINGQDAVYTNGGMWFIVNTPDNKYRLSIADLVDGDAIRLFSEMGIIYESLTFNR